MKSAMPDSNQALNRSTWCIEVMSAHGDAQLEPGFDEGPHAAGARQPINLIYRKYQSSINLFNGLRRLGIHLGLKLSQIESKWPLSIIGSTDMPEGAFMAKLTLSFKDRKLKVFALQSGDSLIGRESDCAIPIDSLAIEPHHARVRSAGEGFIVEPMADNTKIRVNEQTITEAQPLKEGDQIQIGKHLLRFSEESDVIGHSSVVTRIPVTGWLQIQSGGHLGRTIRLNKAFTRIGRPGGDLAVIAHRDQGYYLSHLQGDITPRINYQDLGEESYKLQDGDQITVGELKLQFFADANVTRNSEFQVSEQKEKQQRQFNRIPFDGSVTLQTAQQSWETDLIDISLHGALIKAPPAFDPDQEQLYQLAIHLEGGPAILMNVLIAHLENEEMGLRCKDIDEDSITHLRQLVELNLGNPELMERELSALG